MRGQIRKIILVFYWPIIFVGLYYLKNNIHFLVDAEILELASIHIILNAAIIFILIIKNNPRENFPFIMFFAFFNIVQYGLPPFFIHPKDFQFGTLTPEGLLYPLISIICFYMAYFFIKTMGFNKNMKPLNIITINTTNTLKIGAYILLIFYFLNSTLQLTFLAQLQTPSIYFYCGTFIFFYKTNKINALEKALLIGVILYECLSRSISGLIAQLVMFLFFIALTFLIVKVNKYLILIPIIIFFVFYSQFSVVKSNYREKVWYGGKEYSMMDKLTTISDLIQEKKAKKISYIQDYNGKENFLYRFSYQPSAISYVAQKTPYFIPFWNGESYIPLLSKFVPRAIWPDKPTEDMGQIFGHRYNILDFADYNTSMNAPIIAELYFNFGYTGLIAGGIILGILMRILNSYFNNNIASIYNSILGMALIFPLVIWESNFSLTFGGVFLTALTFYLLFKLLASFEKV